MASDTGAGFFKISVATIAFISLVLVVLGMVVPMAKQQGALEERVKTLQESAGKPPDGRIDRGEEDRRYNEQKTTLDNLNKRVTDIDQRMYDVEHGRSSQTRRRQTGKLMAEPRGVDRSALARDKGK